MAPVAGPLALLEEGWSTEESNVVASIELSTASAAAVSLPMLPSGADAAAAASARSSALTAAAAGEGRCREGGTRPKVCSISALVRCGAGASWVGKGAGG